MSSLICMMFRQITIPRFKSNSHKTGEKSPETQFLKRAKTQVKVGQMLQKSNTKFQYRKGRLRKIRKTKWTDTDWTDRQTGRLMDTRTDGRTYCQTVSSRKPIVPHPFHRQNSQFSLGELCWTQYSLKYV